MTGCNAIFSEPTTEEVLIDRVKAKNADAPWFDHVTSWNSALVADMVLETDYRAEDPGIYSQAVAACEAMRAEISPDTTDSILLSVYGIETIERVKADGSRTIREDKALIAQFYNGDRCGATTPYDLEDSVEALGVPIY